MEVRHLRVGVDTAAASTVGVTLMGYLPTALSALASAMCIIWYLIQFIESSTGRKVIAWIGRTFFGHDDSPPPPAAPGPPR